KEDNTRQFGIRQLRNFSETLNKDTKLETLFKPSDYDNLVSLLVNNRDYREIFELSWVIINLGKCSSNFVLHIAKPVYIKQLFEKMREIEDWVLKNHYLCILCNFIGESEELHNLVISNVDIVNFIVENLKNPS